MSDESIKAVMDRLRQAERDLQNVMDTAVAEGLNVEVELLNTSTLNRKSVHIHVRVTREL